MRKKILIVDDDNSFVVNIFDKIMDKDFSISVADSLSRAKDMLKYDSFDYILANVKVPGGSSTQLKSCTGVDTKFLFMSNLDSDSEMMKKNGERFFLKQEISQNIDLAFVNA